MKLFHLSDLHIGLKLLGRDLYEDQKYILEQVIGLAEEEKPDAVLIAGDIYDKAIPSAEAVDLFDSFVSGLAKAVPDAEIMMISGNHDSAQRINTFRSILEHQRVHMIGLPPRFPQEHIHQVTLRDAHGPVNFYLLPFVKPSMVKRIIGTDQEDTNFSYNETLHRLIGRETIDPNQRNVLVSHQFYLPVGKSAEEIERMDSEMRTVGDIDEVKADVLEAFDYAALGHIHKPMKVGRDEFRYCGTPIACSIDERGQQKGIIKVELGEKGKVVTSVLPLSPLRQVKIVEGTLEDVLKEGCEDYVRVVLTREQEMDEMDLQDRIRDAFPNLLEIRRVYTGSADYDAQHIEEADMDPFWLCSEFFFGTEAPDPENSRLLQDVINTVQGAG